MDRLTRYSDGLFLTFLFLLPFQTIYLLREPLVDGEKWQYGTIGIYLSTLVLACAVMIGAVLKMKASGSESISVRIKKLWRVRKADAFLLLIVFWSGLSILWAQDAVLAGYTFVKIVLAADAFVLTRELVRRGKGKRIVMILFVAGVIQSAIGIGQFLTQETFSSTLLGTSLHEPWQAGSSVLKIGIGRFLRAYGTFPHPNMYGVFLAAILLMALNMVITSASTPQSRALDTPPLKEKRFKGCVSHFLSFVKGVPSLRGEVFYIRIGILSGILIILLGLVVSFSRLAWGGFSLGFAFFLWQRYSRFSKSKDKTWRYLLAISATITISIAVFTGILHETVFPRFDGSVVGRERSVVDRMSTYADAIKLIKDHPILGIGAGNYTVELIRMNPNRPIWALQPAHDVPLLIVAELGLVGFVLSFLFTATYLMGVFETKNAPIHIGALFVLAPSLLLDHFLWTSNFGLLFLFVLLGIIAESGSDE
ncbi:MAG TPA: O-antigen ligase family protein [Candidatus Fimivivens sp.]|nr:O-antigen ligase family protein [Candidatus Fimivivens sp.]